MALERKDYEAVRYQLKKLVGEDKYNLNKYTNNEIRIAAENFQEFDPVAIANQVVANRSTEIVQETNAEIESEQSKALTISEKRSLAKMQASYMGIALSEIEIEQIVSSASNEITDNIEFLLEVKGLIQAYLANRNAMFQRQTSGIVEDIVDVINAGNDELARITEDTNETLRGIVEKCNGMKEDYKSPYKSRLESIRELLKVP
ncbi:hypothetical protein [Anabaena azotica]|uniref:Uncharacterized protein n=1 Tax=Anabaena azotica FACHB-119 TaxID=947527 RepID=A0ABR8DBC6_9NOST|nr:hypothetical protein [Anabaena azotica]MBD2503929.1 hypothetical protein [Anabaena azotica FACHB-119]